MPEKMNPEIKEKWLAALRSGDYSQARGRLCVKNPDGTQGYCCLGVLLDITHPERWVVSDDDDKERYGVVHDPGTAYAVIRQGTLPRDLLREYGLNSSMLVQDLMNMNDGNALRNVARHDFGKIANFIEEAL